jgi:hypothetical protein
MEATKFSMKAFLGSVLFLNVTIAESHWPGVNGDKPNCEHHSQKTLATAR